MKVPRKSIERRRLLVALLTVLAATLLVPGMAAAQADEAVDGPVGGQVLLLVTETVQKPEMRRPSRRFWWSNPTDPQWSETDRALFGALKDKGIGPMEPGGDVRISRIYRTPSLSLDNAAALASILGARRVVVGRVHYELSERRPTWGLVGVRADVSLQLVDAAASEPTALRSFAPVRTVYAGSLDGALQSAREEVASTTASLLSRTLVAEAGPVGPAIVQEAALRLHGVGHGRALDRIRRAVAEADEVDAARIAWASEGLVALRINPGAKDRRRTVDYAARVLANHQFRGMTVRRRANSTDTRDIVFDVKLGPNFDAKRQPPSE